MIESHMLSIIFWLPVLTSAFLMLLPANRPFSKPISISIISSVISLLLSLYLAFKMDGSAGYQFVEKYELSDSIGLYYHLGLDGMSLLFVILTNLLTLSSIIVSMYSVKGRITEYLICFLFLQAISIGFFCAANLLLFYFFFELVLIPMYIIIGVWGGDNIRSSKVLSIHICWVDILHGGFDVYISTDRHF